MKHTGDLPEPLADIQLPALLVGVVAFAACMLGLAFGRPDYYRSYLFAYLFWLGLSLGSMGLAMVDRLVNGEWGLLIRRIHEAAAMTLPLMVLLFIPLLFGFRGLYPWAHPDLVAADEMLKFKSRYLNIPWFIGRAGGYLLLWIVLACTLRVWSLRQDRADSLSLRTRLAKLAAGGIVLYILSMTFASVDWIMSRDPHYFSTIFGLIVVVGQGLSAMAFAVLLLAWMARQQPFAQVVRNTHFNDLGNLLLTFVILFAYLAFAQFLVNWIGNMQIEVPWYVQRTTGGWRGVALAVIVFHFFVPFFLLLSRFNKQQVRIIASIAALLLIIRLVDLFWMVAPSGVAEHSPLRLYWTDFLAPIGIGGIWLAVFLWILGRRPLLPTQALQLSEALHHDTGPALGGVA